MRGAVKCERWGPVAVMVLSNIGMGLVNVLIKKVLDAGLNHMVIATYRLAVSALFLAPFALFLERKDRPKLTITILCQHLVTALLGASLPQFFSLLGLTYTSVTVTCAFYSMLPATTFALALVLRMESLKLKSKAGIAKVAGTLICVSGALILTFYKGMPMSNPHSEPEALESHHNHDFKKHRARNWWLGCLFNFIADMFLSSWMLFQAKVNVRFPCKHSSTVLMSLFGTFQCALLSLIISRDPKGWILRDKFDIFVVIYAGVVGQAVATVAITWCIKKRGPVFTSLFFPVMLISATLLDVIILHRRLYLSSILGSVIVVTGLYVYQWGKHKDLEEDVSSEPTQTEIHSPTRNETREKP